MSIPETHASDAPRIGPDFDPPRSVRDRIAGWLIIPLLVVFIVSFLTFVVFFDVSRVDGPLMLPTLHSDDRVLVTKGYKTPLRGEIVVFTEPGPDGATIDIIKRVVGVPGDTVEIRGGQAMVNGRPEPPHAGIFTDHMSVAPIAIPEGTVYLLGDNRPNSLDSRMRGPIPLSQVRGRAFLLVWPMTRIRLLP